MERDLWSIERQQFQEGKRVICGVDEAGAGPLAGPVYAAAVILPPEAEIPGLDDSKKLSEKKRDALFDVICDTALSWSVALATEGEIDAINILNARMLAMDRAIAGLDRPVDLALIDGNRCRGIRGNCLCVVGGDGKSASIAAASILAKVSRDRVMLRLAEEYPQYEFDRHKGYPTKRHYELLEQYGSSPVHRQSFLRKFYER